MSGLASGGSIVLLVVVLLVVGVLVLVAAGDGSDDGGIGLARNADGLLTDSCGENDDDGTATCRSYGVVGDDAPRGDDDEEDGECTGIPPLPCDVSMPWSPVIFTCVDAASRYEWSDVGIDTMTGSIQQTSQLGSRSEEAAIRRKSLRRLRQRKREREEEEDRVSTSTSTSNSQVIHMTSSERRRTVKWDRTYCVAMMRR